MDPQPYPPNSDSSQPWADTPPPGETNPMDRGYVPPREEVEKRAYYIFLNQGGHNGFDLDHWLEAELQLFAEHNAALRKARAQPGNK